LAQLLGQLDVFLTSSNFGRSAAGFQQARISARWNGGQSAPISSRMLLVPTWQMIAIWPAGGART
jgi:hypothetical protein